MSYKELWKSIFPNHYRDKYKHESGLSGGGGNYPVYDIHIADDVRLYPHYSISTEEYPETKSFKLGHSIEYFDVPDNVILLTKNKSTIARMGVDASFSTLIDNDFKGYLTIEIVNHSHKDVILTAGQPILQVVAIPLMFPADPYNGKYQNQEAKAQEARFEK